jgi:hypothetical protein
LAKLLSKDEARRIAVNIAQWVNSRARTFLADTTLKDAASSYLTKNRRRFPPPWSVDELDACFVVTDSAASPKSEFSQSARAQHRDQRHSISNAT